MKPLPASGFQEFNASADRLNDAKRLRVVPKTLLKKPPMYTLVVVSKAIVVTLLLTCGFHAVSTTPLSDMRAKLFSTVPPIWAYEPPTYTCVPSRFNTSTLPLTVVVKLSSITPAGVNFINPRRKTVPARVNPPPINTELSGRTNIEAM